MMNDGVVVSVAGYYVDVGLRSQSDADCHVTTARHTLAFGHRIDSCHCAWLSERSVLTVDSEYPIQTG